MELAVLWRHAALNLPHVNGVCSLIKLSRMHSRYSVVLQSIAVTKRNVVMYSLYFPEHLATTARSEWRYNPLIFTAALDRRGQLIGRQGSVLPPVSIGQESAWTRASVDAVEEAAFLPAPAGNRAPV